MGHAQQQHWCDQRDSDRKRGLRLHCASGRRESFARYEATHDPGRRSAGIGAILPRARAAEVGRPYALALKGSGGTQPYKWSIEGTLPDGLSLNGDTGELTGLPGLPGPAALKVTMTDANGLKQILDLPLTVAAKLSVSTLRLRAAAAGQMYLAKLAVIGGVRPLRWKIVSGKLPAGVKLDARRGTLGGAPG